MAMEKSVAFYCTQTMANRKTVLKQLWHKKGFE